MDSSQTYTLETGVYADIPWQAVVPSANQPCPLVFYVPGFRGSRADGLPLAWALARRGIACISIDPVYHGERVTDTPEKAADPARGGIYPPETGMDMFYCFLQIIRQSSLDIAALLSYFEADSRLDIHRAGVTGFSLGAYAAFLAFTEIPALRAAVPMMGIPTFTNRWLDLLLECALSNSDWANAIHAVQKETAERTAIIREFDPAERLLRVAPRALLIMNGDFDCDQPKHYALQWLQRARPAYQNCSDNLIWKVYPAAHTVTAQMRADAVDWFGTHL